MSSLKQYARSAGLLTALSVLQRGLGIGVSVVLARGLGPAGLGIFNAVQTTAANGFSVARLGIDAALHVTTAEGTAGHEERQGRLFGAAFVVMSGAGVLAGIACIAAARLLAESLFGQPVLTPWLRVAGALVISQSLTQFAYAGLVGLHQFRRYTTVMGGIAILNAALVTGGVALSGLSGAIWATVATSGLTLIGLAVALRRSLASAGVHVRVARFAESARELFALGMPMYAAGFVALPVAYLLQGLLSRSEGLTELGYLRVVTSLSALVSFIPASVAGATISSLAALRGTDAGDDRRFLEQGSAHLRVVWLVGTLAALGGCALLPWLVPGLFGAGYRSAVFAAALGLLGAVVAALDSVGHQVLFAGRRQRALFVVMTVRPLVFGTLGWLWVSRYGLTGYLAAEGISAAVSFALTLAFFGRHVHASVSDVVHARPVAVLAVLFVVATAAVTGLMSQATLGPFQTGLPLLALAMLGGGVGLRYGLAPIEQAALARIARSAGRRVRGLTS